MSFSLRSRQLSPSTIHTSPTTTTTDSTSLSSSTRRTLHASSSKKKRTTTQHHLIPSSETPLKSPASNPVTPASPSSPLSPPTPTASQSETKRQSTHVTAATNETQLLVDNRTKWRSAWIRTYTTVLMLTGFMLIAYFGHNALVLLVMFVQVSMFREIKRLSRVLSHRTPLESFRPLHWYWFCTAAFFTYTHILTHDPFNYTIPYRTFLSFTFYIVGITVFVLSLRRHYYKYQFEMFAWIHLTLLLVVIQSTFIIINIYQGLIWFLLPALLIITNDTAAYIFGFFFGRTPLIQLSPKKTWEGFIGGCVTTLVVGYWLGAVLSAYPSLTCEKRDLSWSWPQCQPAKPFEPAPIREIVSTDLLPLFYWLHVADHVIYPMQLHALMLAMFASVIAPFGGFFASGFKRAFHIKDFGESIPGHGGVTDRMDCQIIMGLFVYIYYSNFVFPSAVIVSTAADKVFNLFLQLKADQQVAVFERMRTSLIQLHLVE